MKAWERFTLANADAVTNMWEIKIDGETTFGNYIAKIAGTAKEIQ